MSLDKILGLKPKEEKKPKKTEKKKIDEENTEEIEDNIEFEQKSAISKDRHYLKCTNRPKCKGEKILKKRNLEPDDFICRLCKSEMKEYTPRKKSSKKDLEEEEEA